MKIFLTARDQLIEALQNQSSNQEGSIAQRIVQLGDLGSYEHGPGSTGCFKRGKSYLDSFNLPTAMVLGNHDLEGAEFDTDEQNLAEWRSIFRHRHFWSVDVGPATLIGLSTTKFRSNPYSVHEVHIDNEQLEFFKTKLKEAAAAGRPVVVFTHAPIQGSGLKVVQTVHVKNRCAWINHSSNSTAFIDLVNQHPNIKLWFSGHFHLSQSYPDSISVVGGTAFVLTGVIGDCNRDGHRHSRILTGNSQGFQLYTMDHDLGTTRLDASGSWDLDSAPPQIVTAVEELICDPSEGWLCSKVNCALELNGYNDDNASASLSASSPASQDTIWLNAGPTCMLSLQGDIIVEYDIRTMSPIGAVAMNLAPGTTMRLLDNQGNEVDGINGDGSDAVSVEISQPVATGRRSRVQGLHSDGAAAVVQKDGETAVGAGELSDSDDEGREGYMIEVSVVKRNERGTFFRVFQPNKWVLRKKKEAEEAEKMAEMRYGMTA
jgi:hypothetical protein